MAASSSTAVAATSPTPFPTALEREMVLLLRMSQKYNAFVLAVDHGVNMASVSLKIKEKIPKRGFSAGELATLQAGDGRRWAGVVASPADGDAPESLYAFICLHVPYETGNLTGLGNESFLNMHPFQDKPCTLPVGSNCWKLQAPVSMAAAHPTLLKLRVGLIGFGSIGRQVTEVLLDTEDVKLISIVDDLTVYDMVMAWGSRNFTISSCGEKALLFKRRIPELDKSDDIMVTVLTAREHEKNPWGKLSVSYVVDTLDLVTEDNKQIIYQPQLAYDHQDAYTMIYGDKGVSVDLTLPIKYMKVLISSEEATEAIVESFPEWRDRCVRLCFSSECDPTQRICDPLTELRSNYEEEEEEEAKEKEGFCTWYFIWLREHGVMQWKRNPPAQMQSSASTCWVDIGNQSNGRNFVGSYGL